MSLLNRSVIICDASPRSSQRKTPLGSKQSKTKVVKRTHYESPLKHIQRSRQMWERFRAERKLIRATERVANKKKNCFSPLIDASCQDSVIILSDNDSDSGDQEQRNDSRNNVQTEKRLVQTLSADDKPPSRCLRSSNKSSSAKETEVITHRHKKSKNKSDVIPENNITSCLLISDMEGSGIATADVDNENIAPIPEFNNQGSDDIVVVWSSTNSSTQPAGEIKEPETRNQEENNKLFMVDRTPDTNNLSILECNEETLIQDNEEVRKGKKRKYMEEEPDLLFNKQGLTFPKACDISNTIKMRKPKSIIRSLRRLKQSRINPAHTAASSSTSISTSVTTCNVTSNKCSSDTDSVPPAKLREIVIDGNNIAMAHKHGKFSQEGIKIVIDYFKQRGHTVKAFVPQYRRGLHHPLLEKLYEEGLVVFTPSRTVGNKRITPYDDRYILQYATVCKGIVVSLDQYRDLYEEKPEWRDTIANRLIAPTFVGDYVMFPDDPLGRNGPSFEEFLRH